jgi:LuxR family transcriptional regulator, maltose regulon positive regulatory protein
MAVRVVWCADPLKSNGALAPPLPLLATKLAIPAPSPSLVPRPRLTTRLQARAACRLALVVAPAGSGNSSVISQWCQQHGADRVAWLSLDDHEPIRFLHYLGTALATVAPEAAEPARVVLQSPQPPSLHHRKEMSRTC